MCQGFVTSEELVEMLRSEVSKERTIEEYASKVNVSAVYIGLVLNGRQAPGPAISDALGMEKVIRYRPKR